MRKKKSRLLISLLTAFVMAFTIFPYMGVANQASAAEDPYEFDNSAKWNSFSTNTVNLVKSIKYEPQSDGTFDAAINIDTSAFEQMESQDYYSMYGIGYSYKTSAENITSYIYLVNSQNAYSYTVEGIVPEEQWSFKAWLSYDDAGQNPYGGCDFEELTLTAPALKAEDQPNYKYDTVTAEYVPAATASDVDTVVIKTGNYISPNGWTDIKDIRVYKVVNDTTVQKISSSGYNDYAGIKDTYVSAGNTYTYYVVDYYYLTGTAKTVLGAVSSKQDLTPDITTALTDALVTKSNSVKYDFVVDDPIDLKVAKKGVKKAELTWGCTYGNWLTGYKLESFNEKGTLIDTEYYKDGRASGNVVTIPYKGVSKVKVTSYYDNNGVRFWGGSDEVTVESAKIGAAGGGVTKISNSKVRITVNKPEGAAYVKVYKKVNGKWSQIGSKSTKKTYKLTHSKKNAGKASYKVVAYVTENSKVVGSKSIVRSPKSNVRSFSKYGAKYMRDKYGLGTYWKPTYVKYKNGKVVVTGRTINTWKTVGGKYKLKVTVYCDGKKIGYQTISGKVTKYTYNTKTFTCKGSKSGADLRNGKVTFKIKWYKKV